jgi:hypothetical protein
LRAAACLNTPTSPTNDIAPLCPHKLCFSRELAISVTAASAAKLYLLHSGAVRRRMESISGKEPQVAPAERDATRRNANALAS